MTTATHYRATGNGAVLADTGEVVMVEGNACFPVDAVTPDVLQPTSGKTLCFWKGRVVFWRGVLVDRRR